MLLATGLQSVQVAGWKGRTASLPARAPAQVANFSSVHWEKQVHDVVVTDFPFWLLGHFRVENKHPLNVCGIL